MQNVRPRPVVFAVDHLPAPRQQDDHVGRVLADRTAPLVLPGLVGRRPAGLDARSTARLRRVVAGPHELDLGTVDHATAQDPLVGELVVVLVLDVLLAEAQAESEGHRVAEEEDLHRRARG